MSVTLHNKPISKVNVFTNDIISITLDNAKNLDHIKVAPCKVIHAVAHKAKGTIHVKRQDLILDEKNEAEGSP